MSLPLQQGVGLLRRLRPLSRTLAFSRLFRGKRCESSLIPRENVVAPRSCLLYAGWSSETVLHAGLVMKATTAPVWLWHSSQFRHFPLTTLQTQVSLVSIGHRICSLSASWLADWDRCQWASHPKKCRFLTQATPSSCHCSNTTLNE